MPGSDHTADLGALIQTHAPLLKQAVEAIHTRGYWSAFPESPSTRIWGANAPDDGKAAFDAVRDNDFPITTPGAEGTVASERSPYGFDLGVRYPHLRSAGVAEVVAAAGTAMPAWRDAGPDARVAIGVEILRRLSGRVFEMAHAVMHTTGQSFVMAFQAGGSHALDRGLEAIAYAAEAMAAVPTEAAWEKPRSSGEPQRLHKTFTIVPRGIGLVIGCTTFPTWNSYPGLFASLVTGNPVIVKPHPRAVLPLAITVAVARAVLAEYDFDPNIVTLAVEADDERREGLASVLALQPEVRVIDFTGSSAYGEWLETHARQAAVFTEKSGVNCVVVDSTDNLRRLAANLAYSLALYSGQMCTTPQAILIPRDGIATDTGHLSVDEFVAAMESALAELLDPPAKAAAILGALANDGVAERLAQFANATDVAIASRPVVHPDFPGAAVRTPVVLRVSADERERYGNECFGPVAFIVDTESTSESLDIWRELVSTRGSLTASVYSTDAAVLARCEEVAMSAGVSLSENLVADVYVNQSAAFSDFHATGANPAANASLTDAAFVASRFRVVESRRAQ